MMGDMKRPRSEPCDISDGRTFLKFSATMSIKLIAELAGITEAQVLRLIELAKADAAKK